MDTSKSGRGDGNDDGGILSARSRHQLGLFFAGSAFVMLSSLVTRRAILRRVRSVRPPFFHQSNEQPLVKFNGPLEAADALGVATINVFSYALMIGGGLFWAFDISNIRELKERIKLPLDLEKTEEEKEMTEDQEAVSIWPAAAIVLQEEEEKQAKPGTQISETIRREGVWRKDRPSR
jgi:hypothetical protein